MSQAFFVQVKPHKDFFIFKVSSGEVESLGAIKCFNKKNANKINESKLKTKMKEPRILPSLAFGKNASGPFISS